MCDCSSILSKAVELSYGNVSLEANCGICGATSHLAILWPEILGYNPKL